MQPIHSGFSRHVVIPAVYLVLVTDGRLLMLRRANTGYRDGYYSLAAGHLDGGDSRTAAMVREAREEIGVEIDPADLILAHVAHTPAEAGDREPLERIDFYFLLQGYRGPIHNNEPRKCDDLSWFDLADLPPKTIPKVQTDLEAISKSALLSEPDWPAGPM